MTSHKPKLTDEEASAFERLADRYEGDIVGDAAASILQSESNEEASS